MYVVCFDFVPQLLTLLQNRDIMIADNLAIDINKDPLKPSSSPNGTLDEALSGSVYREALQQFSRKYLGGLSRHRAFLASSQIKRKARVIKN